MWWRLPEVRSVYRYIHFVRTRTADDNGKLGVVLPARRVELLESRLDLGHLLRNDSGELALDSGQPRLLLVASDHTDLGHTIAVYQYTAWKLVIRRFVQRQTLDHRLR